MKFYLSLICAISLFWAGAQEWKGYFSYSDVRDLSLGIEKIYAASENAFFRYATIGNVDPEPFNTVDGLSGDIISAAFYDVDTKRYVLGHPDGSLELVDENSFAVTTVVDIRDKATISPAVKGINHIMKFGDFLYLSCDFGISLYDPLRLEFNDTYFIGPQGTPLKVNQTTVSLNYIYAATDRGLFRAPVMENFLIDFSKWEQIQLGDWLGIQGFENKLVAIDDSQGLYELTGGVLSKITTYTSPFEDLRSADGYLVVTTANSVYLYNENLQEIRQVSNIAGYNNLRFRTALVSDMFIHLGTTTYGVLKIPLQQGIGSEQILPEGPSLNRIFGLKKQRDRLWVVYGAYDFFFNPFPLQREGISIFQDGRWTNFSFGQALSAVNMVRITENPKDQDEVFISSFYSGILQINDLEPTVLYNRSNSGLESVVLPGDPFYGPDIRIGDCRFDKEGNLWVLNGLIDNVIKRRNTSGQWSSWDVSGIIADPLSNLGFSELVIDKNGYKFFTSGSYGLFGFSEQANNPIFKNLRGEEDNLPSNYLRCLALDQRGQLWIGTQRGLRVLPSTSNFFEQDGDLPRSIIINDDGQASELLFEQFVSDITVDGSNNKWIGTSDSGVFYVSEDGREVIYHFTKNNSPLPEDNINVIEIDDQTGEVFIGTNLGMVSFKGTATGPNEDLSQVYAYPNPVRPGYTGNLTVAGLMSNSTIKITDIEGNLVFETTSQGGSVQWDLTAFGRQKVASGVYLIFVSSSDGEETKAKKVMVIR